MPLKRPRRSGALIAPLVLLAAFAGCTNDPIYGPQKFFPGSDLRSWSYCDKFGPKGPEPQVCAGYYTLPGASQETYLISFYIPNDRHVTLAVYNESADLVKVLLDQDEPGNLPGFYREPPVEWDFTNAVGGRVLPGHYRIYLRAGDFLTASDLEVP